MRREFSEKVTQFLESSLLQHLKFSSTSTQLPFYDLVPTKTVFRNRHLRPLLHFCVTLPQATFGVLFVVQRLTNTPKHASHALALTRKITFMQRLRVCQVIVCTYCDSMAHVLVLLIYVHRVQSFKAKKTHLHALWPLGRMHSEAGRCLMLVSRLHRVLRRCQKKADCARDDAPFYTMSMRVIPYAHATLPTAHSRNIQGKHRDFL